MLISVQIAGEVRVMDTVNIVLSPPSRAAVERIKAAGFADDDVGAIRVAIADLGNRLGLPSAPASASTSLIPPDWLRSRADVAMRTEAAVRSSDAGNSLEAARKALEIVRSKRCICRVNTGRHHVLGCLLEALVRDGFANWLDVLEDAQRSGAEFNRKAGLPPTLPPGGVVYNPAAMSQNWMRAYIDQGAGKFKERFSHDDLHVTTTAVATGKGVRIDLA
jgi:hypothetical protein